jgi:outer membrane protein TolC
MRKILTLLILFFSLAVYAQNDSLDLEKCRKLTLERYPLTKDMESNLKANSLKIKNIKTVYFPTVNLTGQFVHVKDVPHVPFDNPMIDLPVIGKDQYKVMLEARQVIYDGGLTNRRKSLEEVSLKVDNQDVEVKMYGLNEQVNEVYFLILMFQEQEALLKIARNNLVTQLKVVESGVRNGVLLPGDADVVKAEILKLDQQTAELKAGKISGIEILSELMDSTLNSEIDFVKPNYTNATSDSEFNRPEYELMKLQSEKLEKVNHLNGVKRFPYIGLFGQFGYGYPGMNMLDDKADIIYSFGVTLSWNIWDWGKIKREKQINRVMMEKIETQRDIFDKNLRIATTQVSNNIKKLDATIEKDKEIITLRERITRTKESQLKNGVITSSAYIVELNAETQAKINMQLHEIQRLNEVAKLNTITGNL